MRPLETAAIVLLIALFSPFPPLLFACSTLGLFPSTFQ
jgi:hypothetical protein